MLFDPLTIAFQLVNFLSLVAVLYFVLYGPIGKAMQTRQERLEARWQAAQDTQQRAEAEKAAYQDRRCELENQREEFLAEARQEAELLRQQLTLEARQDVDRLKAAWQQTLRQERAVFTKTLQQHLTARVWEIARHTLRDLADADLEDRAIATFLRRLHDLKAEDRTLLAGDGAAMTLRSSFELSPTSRHKIAAALQAAGLARSEAIQFVAAPDAIFGLELQSQNGELGWNAAGYLRSLEAEVENLIASKPPGGER